MEGVKLEGKEKRRRRRRRGERENLFGKNENKTVVVFKRVNLRAEITSNRVY